MNNFAQTLQSWQPLHTTIAQASATLMGLPFVSLSLSRQRLENQARMSARHTFARLVDVLVLALIFLIPHAQPKGLGIALLSFGVVRFFITVVEIIQLAGRQTWRTYFRTLVRHVGLLTLSVGIVALGIAIYQRSETAMFWPVAIVIGLLGSSSWNAWELLFNLKTAVEHDRDLQKPEPESCAEKVSISKVDL